MPRTPRPYRPSKPARPSKATGGRKVGPSKMGKGVGKATKMVGKPVKVKKPKPGKKVAMVGKAVKVKPGRKTAMKQEMVGFSGPALRRPGR